LLTCAQFLDELNDFLDEALDGMSRVELERHLSKCPNCQVLVDTTKKTVRVFKGLEPCPIPPEVESRLLAAIGNRSRAVRQHGPV
jgi:anti-sigma factor RsiW